MGKRKYLLASLLLLAYGCGEGGSTAATGGSAPEQNNKEYTLRLKPQAEPVLFDVKGHIEADFSEVQTAEGQQAAGQEHSGDFTGTMEMRVTEGTDGNLEIVNKMSNAQVQNAKGMIQMLGEGLVKQFEQENKSTITAMGVPVGEDANESSLPLRLPEQPVKVGDTWETKSGDQTATGKVVAVENVGGRELLRLEISNLSVQDQMTLREPMVVLFDPEAGVPHSIQVRAQFAAPEGFKMNMDMDATRKS